MTGSPVERVDAAQARTSSTDGPDATADLDDQPSVALVLAQLRALLDEKLANHEHRLPPERVLATTLGVGRDTVRRALRILEQDGLIVRRVGRGTYIAHGAQVASKKLHALLTQGAAAISAANNLSARELLEARYAIEPAIAELAALSARPEDIEAMRKCLRKRENASNIDDYEHWDYELHKTIALATHNEILVELALLVNRLRQTIHWRQFRRRSIIPEQKVRADQEHRAIVEAVAGADPVQAFQLMRAHVALVLARW